MGEGVSALLTPSPSLTKEEPLPANFGSKIAKGSSIPGLKRTSKRSNRKSGR